MKLDSKVALSLLVLTALGACPQPEPPEDFVEPKLSAIHEEIFMPRCSATACHGGPGPSAELNLERDPYENLVDVDGNKVPEMKRVVPGDPEASLLYVVLLGPEGEVAQMPSGGQLAAYEIEAIKTWIEDGAAND